MATYDRTGKGGTTGHPSNGRVPYLVENTIDMSAVNSSSGTAAADIIQCLDIPAETCVMAGGIEILTASSSSVVFDLGITGVDPDIFCDAIDATATGHKAFDATDASAMLTVASADTLDILTAGASDTVGKARVWAILCDISGVDETDHN